MGKNFRFFEGILLTLFVLFTFSKPLQAGIITVKGLVVCERVTNAGGRFSFFNIKDRLFFSKDSFPATWQFQTPIILIAKKNVKAYLKAAIINGNGKVIAEMPERLIEVKKYPKYYLIGWNKVKFNNPGKYFIRIYINNRILYIYPLFVEGI